MSGSATAIELVRALAWPGVVAVVFLSLRRELRSLVRERLTRVEGPGGFKAEFERTRVDTEAAAAAAAAPPTSASARAGADVPDEVTDLASHDPSGSILSAYEFLTDVLRQRLIDDGVDTSGTAGWNANRLAALAADRGVITEQSAESVRGLTVLRNLVAHGRAPKTDQAEAAGYLALVSAALYSFRLRGTPPST